MTMPLGQWPTLQVDLGDDQIEFRQQLGGKRHSPGRPRKKELALRGRSRRRPARAIIYTLVEICRRRGQDPCIFCGTCSHASLT